MSVPAESLTHVGAVARHQAALRPNATALICGARRLTFAELDARANQVAHGLAGLLPPTGRIALLDTNSEVFYELFFGAARSGRVLVPINFRLALPEIAYIINDAQAHTLVVGHAWTAQLEELKRGCPCLRQVLAQAPPGSQAADEYQVWRDQQSTAACDDAPFPPETPVIQMYTSGTTGHPKGAMLSHENIMVVPPILLAEYGRREADVALVCLPLFHVSGSMWGLSSLYAGMLTVILPQSTPAAIIAAIADYRVTKTFLVPALIYFLLQEPTLKARDCSSLDLIVYGASPIPVPLMRAALNHFGCRLAQVYGLTETCGALTYLRPEDHLDTAHERRLQSCGRALDGVELRIVDSDGQVLPPETVGEVHCRSRQIMRGYWDRDEENAAVFAGGWFHTGDLALLDADGYLYIVDRLKDMIITGGEKVYPAEVERVLVTHPAIADAGVFGVPDARWGEAVRAAVVVRAGHDLDADGLRAWLRQQLAAYKVPRSFDAVAALPRNAAGKVLKRELRAQFPPSRPSNPVS